MFRLTQVLRNLFLRLEGFFGVIFKGLFSFISKFFGFFAQLFGFSQSGYYLETDAAQSVKKNLPQEVISTPQPKTPDISPTPRSRFNKKKIDDYYIKMAREVNKN